MKRLFFAGLAVVALASCTKESSLDLSLTKSDAMTFAPYAGASALRGTAVNTNTQFGTVHQNFKVAAYLNADKYFGFNQVDYSNGDWKNKETESMYWPNVDGSNLHFGAYAPATATQITSPVYSYDGTDGHSLTFGYNVQKDVSAQVDLMYAVSDMTYNTPDKTTDIETAEAKLHFKHALTQVGFTATKEDDIHVTVTSVTLCNVSQNGTFTATKSTDVDPKQDKPHADVDRTNFGSWVVGKTADDWQVYKAVMNKSSVVVAEGTTATQLTSTSDVMMLLPQSLVAWAPVGPQAVGSKSYLAINCTITHNDGTAPIKKGTVYVPFSTDGIEYETGTPENGWKPGYKLTYNLHFGGGYTKPGGGEDPEPTPGETPKPDEVIPTLRDITYTVTVDEWIPVNGGTVPSI